MSMLPKPDSCIGCSLYGNGQGWVPASGEGANGILLVGEAGGAAEEREGLPFIGEAGWLLNTSLRKAGLKRESFRIHNVLSCRPPGNRLVGQDYEVAAIEHCRPNLERTIARMQPRVIVALGATAFRWFGGDTDITTSRGYVLGASAPWVVPTFHPSYLLPRKGQANTVRFRGVLIRDLRFATAIAKDGWSPPIRDYLLDPPLERWDRWVRAELEQEGPLAFDIETPIKEDKEDLAASQTTIIRIGFSSAPATGVSVPFLPPYLDGIRALLASNHPKVGWNSNRFDLPILRSNGFVVDGASIDAMWVYHFWQTDLPRNLQFASSFFAEHLQPWKHLSDAEPAFYNATDADAAISTYLGVKSALGREGRWDTCVRQVIAFDQVLLEAGAAGVCIDREAREKLAGVVQGRLARLQDQAQAVDDALKPTKVYKRKPKGDCKIVMVPGRIKTCARCGAEGVTKTKHCRGECKGAEIVLKDGLVSEYHKILPFNANSGSQILAYAKAMKHLPESAKSVADDVLTRLVRRFGAKHPIYKLADDIRGVSKAYGTYIKGLQPDERGMVYTNYVQAPSTPRISSRDVNLQNISRRGNVVYAKEIRRTIVARPGRVFVEADSSAIEAVMAGWWMGSPKFIDLAKRGVHDAYTCHELETEFDPTKVPELKKDPDYAKARERNKQLVYLSLYDGSPRELRATWPQYFATEAAARGAQERFFAFVPELKQWHRTIRLLVDKQGYIENPWGWRHYYYDVLQRQRDGSVALGTDAKRVVGWGPQGCAGCFMRDNAIAIRGELRAMGAEDWIPSNFLVHDSYCLDVPKHDTSVAIELLRRTLTRPIDEMGGLMIGCEIKVGPNWADMEVVDDNSGSAHSG